MASENGFIYTYCSLTSQAIHRDIGLSYSRIQPKPYLYHNYQHRASIVPVGTRLPAFLHTTEQQHDNRCSPW
jgi:hypothetical protein